MKDSVLQVERPNVHWDGVTFKMAKANQYVRLLGGNANILGGHVDTLQVVRRRAKLVHAKLYSFVYRSAIFGPPLPPPLRTLSP